MYVLRGVLNLRCLDCLNILRIIINNNRLNNHYSPRVFNCCTPWDKAPALVSEEEDLWKIKDSVLIRSCPLPFLLDLG